MGPTLIALPFARSNRVSMGTRGLFPSFLEPSAMLDRLILVAAVWCVEDVMSVSPEARKVRSWFDRLWPPLVLIAGLIAAAAWTVFLAYKTITLIVRML